MYIIQKFSNFHSRLSNFISFFYIFIYLYLTLYRYFISTPIIGPIRKSETAQEIYFNNEMGGYLWDPKDESVSTYENVLIYCVGFDGNASGRFALVRKLQNLLPTYTIVLFDYPGFGLSYTLEFSFSSIISRMVETMNSLIDTNHINNYHLMGEGMGCYIINRILCRKIYKWPKTILFLNPIHDVCSYYVGKSGWYAFPFLLPSLLYKKTIVPIKVDKFAIIFNEEDKLLEREAYDEYFSRQYTSNIFSNKIASIKGHGLSSFLLPVNDSKIFRLSKFLFKE
jgi:hypothetical protein